MESEDKDILRLIRALNYVKRKDLAELLKFSKSSLLYSSTYGSKWNSTLTTFEIFSPPSINDKLKELSETDKKIIFDAVVLIYPVRENEPEINWIEYYPDFDLEEDENSKQKIIVEVKDLKRISFDYIHEQIKKCEDKIENKDFEGAVTNSRALIESICLFIMEEKLLASYKYEGDLGKLYKEVAKILKMSPGDYEDNNLRMILSGTFSIINGIGNLRNTYSDSHGSAPSKIIYKIDERHARLCVNLAKTIAEYLFLSYEKSEKRES